MNAIVENTGSTKMKRCQFKRRKKRAADDSYILPAHSRYSKPINIPVIANDLENGDASQSHKYTTRSIVKTELKKMKKKKKKAKAKKPVKTTDKWNPKLLAKFSKLDPSYRSQAPNMTEKAQANLVNIFDDLLMGKQQPCWIPLDQEDKKRAKKRKKSSWSRKTMTQKQKAIFDARRSATTNADLSDDESAAVDLEVKGTSYVGGRSAVTLNEESDDDDDSDDDGYDERRATVGGRSCTVTVAELSD